MIGLIAFLLLLAVASIALACVEAAFYLARHRRLAHVSHPNPRADLANRYIEDPPSLLMPVHIGTYTAHVGMTVIITALLIDHIAHWAMVVAFATMAAYLLLFRLTLPYALVRSNPERSLLLLLPVFHVYARALAPLVAALRKRATLQTAVESEGGEAAPAPVPEVPPPPVHDSDELRVAGALGRFSETLVRDVMTPRPDIVAVPAAGRRADLIRVLREAKYSRVPVFGDNLDDIVGFVAVRDLLEHDAAPEDPLRPLIRRVFLVPETKKIAELLKEFQTQRTTFAVAIDEYGGTAGVVSVEDIVEELVGEISDEYDVESEPLVVEPDGAFLASGRLNLLRLEQALEQPLVDSDDISTVGGFVTAVFGRIPRIGERIEYADLSIEVVDAEGKRVKRARFRRKNKEGV